MGPLSAKADLCFYIFRVEAEKRELSASQKSKFSLLIKTQKNLEKQLQEAGQEINELRKTVTFPLFPYYPFSSCQTFLPLIFHWLAFLTGAW